MREKSAVAIIVLLLIFGGWYIFFAFRATQDSPLPVNDPMSMATVTLSSSVFEHEGSIPSKYTCDADDVSPSFEIGGVPEEAQSLVLIMDDPDAPVGTWDHWVVFNIPPETTSIPENTEPQGVAGNNSWGRTGYGGPCPPDGEHRYFFKLYAIDAQLSLSEGATKTEVEQAMEGHVVAETQLMGRYTRE